MTQIHSASIYDDDDDLPAEEAEAIEEEVVDRASAARTIAELQAEIRTLQRLENLAQVVRRSNTDRKWEELSSLLQGHSDASASTQLFDRQGGRRKLIIFTEYRDTLSYLSDRIQTLIGRPEAVVTIHGGIGREERRKTQEEFSQDPDVQILIATDAAGEGINLQRAHLMVNYDLPWNPNRVEQRFGRIHRIGQTEVCHLWNLVASETREGDVFHTLLRKLEQQRVSLGGAVFDVLGKCFTDTPLRSLLMEAIRYGDQPEIRARLTQNIDSALDQEHLRELIEESALAHGIIDTTRLNDIREEMERAEARRLQPHYISSFFREAFALLGGRLRERESKRYQLTHVPAAIRNRDRVIGVGEPVLTQYERIAFEKDLLAIQGKPLAAFVCPGHPLLDSTLDLILECHHDLLKRGAVLVDPQGQSDDLRVLFYLEQKIQDGRVHPNGARWIVSQQMQFLEIDEDNRVRHPGYAPYLDYRPITDDERPLVTTVLEAEWLSGSPESQIIGYAVEHLIPEHLSDVKAHKEELVQKTLGAVKDRLTKEINYWDHRAHQLRLDEEAGRRNARINAVLAKQRADDLTARLERRMEELEQERQISPLPPVVIGGALVVPQATLDRVSGETGVSVEVSDRERIDRLAVAAVMEAERRLGRDPREMPHENPGYDIESKDPSDNKLLFIEVKGKAVGSTTLTVSKTQILTAFNKPDAFILAIVEVDGDIASEPRYVRQPFETEPDFGATSVNYELSELLARSEPAN